MMPNHSAIFRSSRTDKKDRPMNTAIERIFVNNNWSMISMISIIAFLMRFYLNLQLQEQLDVLASEGPNTSNPLDNLSRVLGLEHSGRIHCRPGHTSMSY